MTFLCGLKEKSPKEIAFLNDPLSDADQTMLLQSLSLADHLLPDIISWRNNIFHDSLNGEKEKNRAN